MKGEKLPARPRDGSQGSLLGRETWKCKRAKVGKFRHIQTTDARPLWLELSCGTWGVGGGVCVVEQGPPKIQVHPDPQDVTLSGNRDFVDVTIRLVQK